MNYITIGKIQKTFGANGELMIALYDTAPELLPNPIFISIDGLNVPFYIGKQSDKGNKIVVTFDDVEGEALAKELIGKEIFIEQKNSKANAQIDSHPLIGYTVEDEGYGIIGAIADWFDYPGNPVLQIITPQGKEVLIPDSSIFALKVDKKAKLLKVKLPEGLLDVYLNEEEK